ncbi:MAG TPA: wax ester/triacylglycerol synthase family O-acyltransferase [Candidatus Binatia bacterium]|nr:wax ester/triacylglycerol synthase family O-acyltransferase [Candidatus Binatia bacterium]
MPRLSPIDAAFLRMESPRTPMHVGGLLTFRLPAGAPPDWLQKTFAFMKSQPVTAPPFNWRLADGALRRVAPKWEEADELDLDYHLRHSALPWPGGERELGILVSRLHSHPMDLTRPLWECHLIEGLENGRFAVYLKAHHAAVDGVGALKHIRNWLSEDPAHDSAAGPWALPPRPAEADADLPRSDVFRSALEAIGHQLRSAGQLAATLRRMAMPRDNPEGGLLSAFATPRSAFNVRVSPQRRLATQLFELDRLKRVASAAGVTLNDLMLALAGGALRRYLLEIHALPAQPLIASVPVALPRADGKPGNAVAGFVVPLVTQDANARKRLRRIQAVTSRTKEQLRHLSPGALNQFSLLGIAPLLLSQITGLSLRLRPLFNIVVSNVVGSRNKLYFRGAELEAMYPVSVLFDGYALNLSIVGYGDRVTVGYTGCREALPSLQRLAVYTGEELAALEAAVLGKPAVARPRMRKKKSAGR